MKLHFARSLSLLAFLAIGCSSQDDVDDEDPSSAGATEQGIVGGSEAVPGAWAGMVALYKGGSRPSCGGTLVADQWVLTASHCVTSGSTTGGVTKVVIGRHRLSSSEGETRLVAKAFRHPRFSSSTLDNDVALLQLTQKSLAPKSTLLGSTQATAVAANAMTTVTGWGTMSEGGSTSDVLRQVGVPVIENTTCKTYSGYSRVTTNMICAGYAQGGRDSCQGDSGGPLFVKVGDKQLQAGLVSWGIGCARARAPGVYTRLTNYLGWLYETSGGAVGENPNPPAVTPAPVTSDTTPTTP
jgi:secreted trypsin-like serine protease